MSAPRRQRLASAALPLLLCVTGCSIGSGQGTLDGTVSVVDCPNNGAYEMQPTFFGAEAVQEVLQIRVQRGSDRENTSDGLDVLVSDAAELQANHLDEDLPLGEEDSLVRLTLYLNETCPAERDRTPVALPAVSGTVRFESVYAPSGGDGSVAIKAELSAVHFEDPRNVERAADIEGFFDFLFERGSPAQSFP